MRESEIIMELCEDISPERRTYLSKLLTKRIKARLTIDYQKQSSQFLQSIGKPKHTFFFQSRRNHLLKLRETRLKLNQISSIFLAETQNSLPSKLRE